MFLEFVISNPTYNVICSPLMLFIFFFGIRSRGWDKHFTIRYNHLFKLQSSGKLLRRVP